MQSSSKPDRRWRDDRLKGRLCMVAAAIVGSSVVGGMMTSDAAGDAANAQANASAAEIAERRRQFEQVQTLLKPYVDAGTAGLTAQQNLAGINGNAAQAQAIGQINSGEEFGRMAKLGENAILQNASATGGLRGGNVQGALAQFRPAMLSALIDKQYERLGGFTSLGQNAAVGTGNAGMQTGAGIGAALQQMGAAQAGGALGQARAWTGAMNGAVGGFGMYSANPVNSGFNLQSQFSQTGLGRSGFGTGLAYGNQDMGMYL